MRQSLISIRAGNRVNTPGRLGISLPLLLCISPLLWQPVQADQSASPQAVNPQLQALQQHEKNIALVLAQQGFDAYSRSFHPAYHNWPSGKSVKDRSRFLADVKIWYEQGNKAVAVQMQPLHSELIADFGLSQYRLREDFNNGESFVGTFTSLSKQSSDGWQFYNTSFHTEYYGPTAEAPAVAPARASQ
ncbi:MAG: hypothetical protein U5L02_09000 [Rheinheimera sp.]|nr:hypothetical protein [Rheinheimera sp.]